MDLNNESFDFALQLNCLEKFYLFEIDWFFLLINCLKMDELFRS